MVTYSTSVIIMKRSILTLSRLQILNVYVYAYDCAHKEEVLGFSDQAIRSKVMDKSMKGSQSEYQTVFWLNAVISEI